jgi:ABC-type multidrug transport system permease subunit
MSKNLVELPPQITAPILLSIGVYFSLGLNDEAGRFPVFIIISILLTMCGVSVGLLAGCMFSDIGQAVAIAPLFVIPHMLFAGFLTNTDSIPAVFIWLEYTSPFKFGFSAYVENEYEDLDLDCDSCSSNDKACVECDPLEDLNLT